MAAAAYMSCSKIYNDYDGITHDYTRKQGLVWEQIFLPDNAPREWADRSVLWNAVEASEKSKDSRLARELIVALPKEVSAETNQRLLTDFVQQECVAKGMCAHVCYHDTDGHNPHAHIMLTVRPLNKNGTWQHKTEKEYLCVRNGEERSFTASEYLQAQKDGWEKQYQYKVGKVKEYLPPSRAEGLERVNKYPKSSKYGRQNPISAEWNSEEQISRWREAWERCVNRTLQENEIDQRIDHRSHKARGLLIKPTIHEGVIAIAMERKGYKSDRRAFNRSIFRYNKTIEDWVTAIEYLIKSVFLAVSRLADEMEDVRSTLIGLAYDQRRGYNLTEATQDTMERFDQLKEKADGLDAEQQARLTAERLHIRPQKEGKAAHKLEESNGAFSQRLFCMCRATVDRWLGEAKPREPKSKERKEPERGGW